MASMVRSITHMQTCLRAARTAAASKKTNAVVLTRSLATTSDADGKSEPKYKKQPRPSEEEGLYDPYKLYEESSGGNRGYREFNPDLYEGENLNFTWTEPEQMMADKSWPATTGSDLFTDLLNIPSEPPSGEKLELILKEAFRRMGHTSIKDIKLPEIGVKIPEDNEDREALEIMKLSLMNNGRIKMDDKNEIMKSLIDELQHLRKDKTTLFKGLE